jgi:hypothetical protein
MLMRLSSRFGVMVARVARVPCAWSRVPRERVLMQRLGVTDRATAEERSQATQAGVPPGSRARHRSCAQHRT